MKTTPLFLLAVNLIYIASSFDEIKPYLMNFIKEKPKITFKLKPNELYQIQNVKFKLKRIEIENLKGSINDCRILIETDNIIESIRRVDSEPQISFLILTVSDTNRVISFRLFHEGQKVEINLVSEDYYVKKPIEISLIGNYGINKKISVRHSGLF